MYKNCIKVVIAWSNYNNIFYPKQLALQNITTQYTSCLEIHS